MRAGAPTAWTPESKPIWLIELGCPAIDKGANAPSLFTDDKSAESAPPPFSSGARDDLIQRRTLEAYLRYWDADGEHNPTSALTGRHMIERAFLWAWDARPYPAFPTLRDVWSDGGAWRRGHWLNGRAGLSMLGEVVSDLCARAGVDVDASALVGALSGYVVDAPLDARAALEPLMAAYDFSACERDGAIVFLHGDDAAPVDVALGELTGETIAERFAQRADAADAPIEARVRFIDAERDYLIGVASARRLDRAEGGVVSVDAPLVLGADASERIAQRVLADHRAAAEALSIELGPARLALEPGDRITLAGGADTFEITRIDDGATRGLDLRRARALVPPHAQIGEPSAPVLTSAPTPAASILDLPPLPNAESETRPLAAIYASPWRGAHELFSGDVLTRRAIAYQPAIMGELLWAFWPGPVGRWDDGNVIRVTLYGGSLASATSDAVLNGDNVFAIESADGEWEVVQARVCDLVGPNTYQLSGFLRGQLGSAHAMRAPHPVGARIVKLDTRLARVEIGPHEWNEPLTFTAPPANTVATDARAEHFTLTLPHAALRPWAPAHLRARRTPGGDVAISWVRCARLGGDSWGPGDPPLGSAPESYVLNILDGDDLKRSVNVTMPAYLYGVADQTADFGAPPASLRLRVAQMGENGAPGLNKELTITL